MVVTALPAFGAPLLLIGKYHILSRSQQLLFSYLAISSIVLDPGTSQYYLDVK
jgi:hypothetical protein